MLDDYSILMRLALYSWRYPGLPHTIKETQGMAQQTVSSLAEFYASPASMYASFTQEHRSGGSLPMRMLRAEQDAFDGVDPAVPEVVLGLTLQSDMLYRRDLGDGLTKEIQARSGDFNLVPSDTESRHDCRDRHEMLVIMLPKGPLTQLLENHRAGTTASFDTLTCAITFRDQTLRRTAMQMWAESARVGGSSDLLMDGLTQVLVARLLDKAGAMHRRPIIVPLSQSELTRLDGEIEDRLAERLTVEDLAQVLDMPRWTFADAFKVTTGDTPHSYVTTKRVERACDLLRLGDMPLAEIAYATGFASQSHMTDTFRRVLGTTPGKWRKEVRS